jgi:two-component system, LytTR family, response regulator
MKAIIVDDEIHCVKSLMWDLKEVAPEVQVVATASSGEEGLTAINQNNPDVVFLDVSMPGMNGFEILEQISDINFSIIFTTAYDQYASMAFRKSAIDYLVKPVDKHELLDAIRKVTLQLAKDPDTSPIINLLKNYRQPEALQRIAFPTRDGYEFIHPDHITYLEAEGSYTKVYLSENRNMLISKSLGDLAEMLPVELFIRIHHSYIVNKESITHFLRTDGGYVQLKTGIRLMVSKSRKNSVLDKLGLK